MSIVLINKKVIFTGLVIMLSFALKAQTIDEAKKIFNDAVTLKNEGNLEESINQFYQVISICDSINTVEENDDAFDLLTKSKGVIPGMYLILGSNKLQNNETSAGIEFIYKARSSAKQFADDETLTKCLSMIPQAHYALGAEQFKAKNYDEAIAQFNKAIDVDSVFTKAYYMIAVVYKTQNKDAELIKASKKAIKVSEGVGDTKTIENVVSMTSTHFLKKGNAAKEASKYTTAVENLKTCLSFDSKNETAYFLLATVYNAMKRWDDAIDAAKNGVKNDTGSATVKARYYYEMATAYAAKGDKTNACNAYSKAAFGDYAANAKYQREQVLKCN